MPRLNPKQRKFINKYIATLNATEAALAAGYSPKTAASQGCRLLKHADIKAAIARRQAKLAERLEISQERVLQELAEIAFGGMNELLGWGPGAGGMKVRALDQLARHLGMYNADKSGVTVNVLAPETINKPEDAGVSSGYNAADGDNTQQD